MPTTRLPCSFTAPSVDLGIGTGSPLLSATIDGFLKIGAVGAAKSLAEDAYDNVIRKGNISGRNVEKSLKKMCKEGAYWGSVAGVYVGVDYGMEQIRGTNDWKNAMVAGALTGAIISVASQQEKDKIVTSAITGGAIATASSFLNYLAC